MIYLDLVVLLKEMNSCQNYLEKSDTEKKT